MALPRRRSALAMAMLCLVILAPSGQASPVADLLPPEDLEGGYEDGTVVLQWQPPAAAPEPLMYRVYHNAHLIGETQDTSYNATPAALNVFHVTAWYDGKESVPSQPIALRGTSNEPECEIVGTEIDLDNPPFVFILIYEECIPPLPISHSPALPQIPNFEWRG